MITSQKPWLSLPHSALRPTQLGRSSQALPHIHHDHTLTVPRAASVPARFKYARTLGRLRKIYRPYGRKEGGRGCLRIWHPTDSAVPVSDFKNCYSPHYPVRLPVPQGSQKDPGGSG